MAHAHSARKRGVLALPLTSAFAAAGFSSSPNWSVKWGHNSSCVMGLRVFKIFTRLSRGNLLGHSIPVS